MILTKKDTFYPQNGAEYLPTLVQTFFKSFYSKIKFLLICILWIVAGSQI